MAHLNQAEIRVGPSQFFTTVDRVRRVLARGVIGRQLKSKKEYSKVKLINKKQLLRITLILS